ncbi:MAG: hypothetical protein LBC39_05760 [Methanobrevibacter sp.]|nr:hypothetical protein [Candidatus Methanovirga aequatorialis]
MELKFKTLLLYFSLVVSMFGVVSVEPTVLTPTTSGDKLKRLILRRSRFGEMT